MAEQEKNKLSRHLGQIKRLDPEVTLLKYTEYIKPFLFGTNAPEPLDFNKLPKTGVYGQTIQGVVTPKSQIYANVVGKPAQNYEYADVQSTQFIADAPNIPKIGTKYFFPSDLVSVLTGIAKIFYRGDGRGDYNRTVLEKFATATDDVYWVDKWGNPNSDSKLIALAKIAKKDDFKFFYEEVFITKNAQNINQLLTAVKDAAKAFEESKTSINTAEFELKSELEKAITDLLVTQVIEKYKEALPNILSKKEGYEVLIKPQLEADTRLLTKTIESKKEEISDKLKSKITTNSIEFFRELYSPGNLAAFASETREIYDQITNRFLLRTRNSDQKPGVLDSEEYRRFAESAVKKLLEDNQEELTVTFILPLFVAVQQETVPASATPEQEGGDSDEPSRILENPVAESELLNILRENILAVLLKTFSEKFAPEYRENFLELQKKLPTNYLNTVTEFLTQKIAETINEDLRILEEERQELIQQNLYVEEQYTTDILKSDWYKELLKQSVEYIQNTPSPDSQYSSLFIYLFETFITPLLETDESEVPSTPVEPPTDSDDSTSPLPGGAVVPPVIPVAPPAEELTIVTDDITRLTQEETRQLQYEAAWLYNRAVYELSASEGRELTAEELRTLQSKIYSFTAQMQVEKVGDFTKLFGSATARQKALLEFYTRNGHLDAIQKLYSGPSKGKTDKDQIDTLLQRSLNETIKIDSPIFTGNVKNTLDALIIQYGLNQDFFAFDPTTKTLIQYSGNNQHDVLWFIENIPIERLAVILNIPEGALKNDPDIITALKEALKKYAQYRASELSLHIQNASLQNGLVKISDKDAEKIRNGDQETIAKHLSFTSDLRNLAQNHGSDTVVAALDDEPGNRKEKILKQYKTFIPLWNQLSGDEQKLIYEKYGIPFPRDFDPEIKKLDFIPEFILFDPSQLKTIQEIAINARLSAEEKRTLLAILEEKNNLQFDQEIIELIEQHRREQELAAVLNSSYTNNSDPGIIQEISERAGDDFENLSFFEKFQTEEEIRSADEFDEAAGAGGLVSRLSNSRLGKQLKSRFGKNLRDKLDPTEKAKKAAKEAATKAVIDAAAKAASVIPYVGTAASVALLAMKNKIVREFVTAAIAGGLALLIGKTFYALGSLGGLIGGLVGGVVGFAVGGPAGAVAGVITGANIGQAIVPQRLDLLGSGRGSTVITATSPSTAAPAAAATTAATGIEGLLGTAAGIGVVAVGGFAFMGIAITLFTIFTIQSSFLIPVPANSLRSRSDSNLPPGQSLCWPTSGYLTQVDVSGHKGIHQVNGITQAIDVGCGETANCPDGTGESINPPAIYASHDGVANIISIRDGYGLHIIVQSPQGYRTIYAHMSSTILPSGTTESVSRGDLLGYMGATGNSTGQHLHYEYSGGLIRDILPSAPVIPPANQIPGGTILQIPVAENCSTGGELPAGFMAVGPQTPGNIVTTDSSLVSTPQIVCSWKDSQGLAAAINGNFYNSPTVPIGFGGSNPTKYYANAENRGGPEYMGFNMRALIVNQSGLPSIIKIDQQWYNAGAFPVDASQYSHAVTGLSELTSDDGNKRQKTAIGLGEATGKCGTFVGDAVFLGAIQQGEWSDLKRLMQHCGASEFVFMDAGGSASFCSDTLNMPSTRPMPVNVGLKNAEVLQIGQ